MAQPQWRPITVNFGGSNQALASAQRGIGDFTKGMGDIRRDIYSKEQQEIQNQLARDKLAQQDRLASDKLAQQMTIAKMPYEEKARVAGLQADVMAGTPKNLIAEEVGGQIASEYDALSQLPESAYKQNKLDAFYRKYQTHEAAPEQRKGAVATPEFATARSVFDKVSDVSARGEVIDPVTYSNRIKDEALKAGLGLDTAVKMQKSALQDTPTTKDMNAADKKALQKASEVTLKSNLKYLENLYKPGAKGTTKKSRKEKETAMWDKVNKEFPNTNWFSDNIGGTDLKAFLRDAMEAPGGEYLTPDDITSALSSIKEGELNAYMSADPTANKNLLIQELNKKINKNKQLGSVLYGGAPKGISADEYSSMKNKALANYQREISGTLGKNTKKYPSSKGYAEALLSELDTRPQTGKVNNIKETTKASNRFDSDTAIGKAMNSPKSGELLKVATDDPSGFKKEYDKLSKNKKNRVDAILNASVSTAVPTAPVAQPSAPVTTVNTANGYGGARLREAISNIGTSSAYDEALKRLNRR